MDSTQRYLTREQTGSERLTSPFAGLSMLSSVTTLKWTERGGRNVNNRVFSQVRWLGQATATCLTREVDGFVCLDERLRFVGLKHDFS